MQKSTRTLLFGRDPLGRRSLLIHRPTKQKPYFLLSSVSAGSDAGYDLEELPSDHLYTVDIATLTTTEDVIYSSFWSYDTDANLRAR